MPFSLKIPQLNVEPQLCSLNECGPGHTLNSIHVHTLNLPMLTHWSLILATHWSRILVPTEPAHAYILVPDPGHILSLTMLTH